MQGGRNDVTSMVFAILKRPLVIGLGLGFVLGYSRALGLSEEERRRVRKALFELKEMPRRLFI